MPLGDGSSATDAADAAGAGAAEVTVANTAAGATNGSASTRANNAGGADYQVLTPERVELGYDVASLGSRAAALLVDSVIQVVALGAAVLALWLLVRLAARPLQAAVAWLQAQPAQLQLMAIGVVLAITIVIAVAILWGYSVLFEIAWN